MARPKQEQLLKNPSESIKAVARRQMATNGTAGVSLRAIARELNITAPAIYNYFPRLDDLITALIVDAFRAIAQHMEQASLREGSYFERVRATVMSYRQWAVDNPIDFQLIYGNPIPGYTAPTEVTAPLARLPFQTMMQLFMDAREQGEFSLSATYQFIPASISSHLAQWMVQRGYVVNEALFCMLMTAWARIHGMVMLELNHHLQPAIGDAAALFAYEVDVLLSQVGFSRPLPARRST